MVIDTIINHIEDLDILVFDAPKPWTSGSSSYEEAIPSDGHLIVLLFDHTYADRTIRKPICGQELFNAFSSLALDGFYDDSTGCRHYIPDPIVQISVLTEYLTSKGITL